MHVFLLLYYYYNDKLRKTVSVTRNIYIPEPGDIIFYAYPTKHKEYDVLTALCNFHLRGLKIKRNYDKK